MNPASRGPEVAITGWGAVTPLGIGVGALLDGWCAGRVATNGGFGTCDDFDPAALLSKHEARSADRTVQLALGATMEAIETAGWHRGCPWESQRIACVMATNFGGLESLERSLRLYEAKGANAASPRGFTRSMQSSLASTLTIKFGWRGESMTLGAGCAGGLQAVGVGARLIRLGVADAVVVGGSDAFMTDWAKDTFKAMGALSSSQRCRPYDRDHDGMVPSEGAATMILERHTEERHTTSSTPSIRLGGFAATSDAHHPLLPDADGHELARALSDALASARLTPADIDYINPHGAGTPVGDQVEVAAITNAFGAEAAHIPVSSTKSAIGHLQGAAGTVELIATAAAIDRGIAAPTIDLEHVADGLDLAFITQCPAPLHDRSDKGFRAGLSLSFGLGGQNAAAVVCTNAKEKGPSACLMASGS